MRHDGFVLHRKMVPTKRKGLDSNQFVWQTQEIGIGRPPRRVTRFLHHSHVAFYSATLTWLLYTNARAGRRISLVRSTAVLYIAFHFHPRLEAGDRYRYSIVPEGCDFDRWFFLLLSSPPSLVSGRGWAIVVKKCTNLIALWQQLRMIYVGRWRSTLACRTAALKPGAPGRLARSRCPSWGSTAYSTSIYGG